MQAGWTPLAESVYYRCGGYKVMTRYIFGFYRMLLRVLNMPIILAEYFRKKTGEEYGVGLFTKLVLVWKMARNNRRIISASHWLEHLTMATNILSIPMSTEGCVIECGCYKGSSTANLSLVCALCRRQLEVFDSFEGLPEPSNHDKAHTLPDRHQIHTYARGAFYANLEEVQRNISRYGQISVCNFKVGYFDSTLSKFNKKCSFIFLDVDLRDSVETCCRYL